MAASISIINGPNLNLVGKREPNIYGTQSLTDYLHKLAQHYQPAVQVQLFQSNIEGDIVNELQRVGFSADGIVLNAGGYSHTSVAIADAVAAISTPVIEVHISNIYSREPYRHHSMLSPVSIGVIAGLGLDGYRLAIEALLHRIHQS